jgi:hypothetical protein
VIVVGQQPERGRNLDFLGVPALSRAYLFFDPGLRPRRLISVPLAANS